MKKYMWYLSSEFSVDAFSRILCSWIQFAVPESDIVFIHASADSQELAVVSNTAVKLGEEPSLW